MSTIKTDQADESAATRLAVWKWTIDFAKKSPFGGGFEAYRQNQIRYNTAKIEGQGPQQPVDKTLEVDKARAYHSAYFEMLGEQGYPGRPLLLPLNLIGLFRTAVLRRR